MKGFTATIKEPLAKGLAPNLNPRNRPLLYDSVGAYPYDDTLQSPTSFAVIDTSALTVSFPYPQLFVTSNFVIVCIATEIYEWDGSSLTSKISGLTTGTAWSMASYKDYLIFSNGQVTVERDPVSGIYAISSTLPTFTAILDYNGQALIGSPNKAATSI